MPEILELPILPIRNTVIFPVLAFPINVGRSKSIGAVERALEGNRKMAIFAQKDPSNENPEEDDLFEVGSMIEIIKHVKMPGNKLSVVIRGVSRIRMRRFYAEDDCLRAEVEVIDSAEGLSSEDEMSLDQLVSELQDLAQRVFDLSPQVPSEASFGSQFRRSQYFSRYCCYQYQYRNL